MPTLILRYSTVPMRRAVSLRKPCANAVCLTVFTEALSFYQRKEIKDVIAYFRLIVNPNDEEAFKRIINYPARGIGDTTVGKIIAAATGHNVSLWTVLCDAVGVWLELQ